MIIARTIGCVTLARCHRSLDGATLRCVEPIARISDDGEMESAADGDTVIAWDLCGAGLGDLVAMAEGPEAAQPFSPDIKPLDASIVAILDELTLQ